MSPPEPSVPQTTPALLRASDSLPVALSSIETQEHFGEHLVGELRITSGSRQPYDEGLELPEGTQIALRVQPRGNALSSPQVLWMEKQEGLWTFEADRGDGNPRTEEPACARCHAEAAVDFVFRIRTMSAKVE